MENKLKEISKIIRENKIKAVLETRYHSMISCDCRESVIFAQVPDFVEHYYSYTLDCGHSWDNKVNVSPKTIASLVSNVARAYDATNNYRSSVEVYDISPKALAEDTRLFESITPEDLIKGLKEAAETHRPFSVWLEKRK